MITKGLDNCLYVYPNDEWQQFADKLNQLPMTNKSARQFKRFFNSGAVKCETDAQGRVIIPQTLRTFANIEKDVVIIGNGEKAEIWNKEAWDEINNEESLIWMRLQTSWTNWISEYKDRSGSYGI